MTAEIPITLAHSPDPDDVFMWWPLGTATSEPTIDTGPFRFTPVPEDIQVLNQRAITTGDLDVTAISIHAYPHLKDRYRLTSCAGSFGEAYGPKLITRENLAAHLDTPMDVIRNREATIAVPGVNTTAFLVTHLLLEREFRYIELPFDQITGAVADGRADAGLVIHDAQLTYAEQGLVEIVDLGRWWGSANGLPLPLGGNVIRRDLDDRYGPGTTDALGVLLYESIEHALENWQDGKSRIGPAYPDLDDPTLDRYLRMYVSDLTLDPGEPGRAAIDLLLHAGFELGLSPDPEPIDILECRRVDAAG